MNLEQEIRTLVAEILEMDPPSIDGDAKFVEDLGVDSMLALEILAAIEKKYKTHIPEENLPKMTSLNETIRVTRQHVAGS